MHGVCVEKTKFTSYGFRASSVAVSRVLQLLKSWKTLLFWTARCILYFTHSTPHIVIHTREKHQKMHTFLHNLFHLIYPQEHAVVHAVEALRYKPEGRGFDSR
jgi:hypothetical protein